LAERLGLHLTVAFCLVTSPVVGAVKYSVCSLQNNVLTSEIFSTCYPWPWLGPPLDDNTVHYVLPVLWMTSCLPIMDHMVRG